MRNKAIWLALAVWLVVASSAVAANPGKTTGASQYEMAPAGVVFPVWPYTNGWQIYEASGKVVVNLPRGDTALNVTVNIKRCLPNEVYRVDLSGNLTWGTYMPGAYWWRPLAAR